VIEVGEENGHLHLHLAINLVVYPDSPFVDFNKLSRRARLAGEVWIDWSAMQAALEREGAGVGDFRQPKFRLRSPAGYLAKYFTKDMGWSDLPPHTARAHLRGPDVKRIRKDTGWWRFLGETRKAAEVLKELVDGGCCKHPADLVVTPGDTTPDGRHYVRVRQGVLLCPPVDTYQLFCDCLCHWLEPGGGISALGAIDLSLDEDYHSKKEKVS
jgi:hypothetical protein